MLKKIFLSICLIAIIAYLSLWAWAVHWIDEDKHIADFMGDNKNITLETAKFIWKMTPDIDREKEAQRALTFSELSVNTEIPNLSNNLKMNYDFISSYYQKNEQKLSDDMKNRFLLRKFVFIIRSLLSSNRIKDIEFEKSLEQIAQTIPKMNLQQQIEWNAEFAEFYLWHTMYDNKNVENENIRQKTTQYFSYLNDNLQEMNKRNNTTEFDIIIKYHYATLSCNTLRKVKNYREKDNNLNKFSADIFEDIQKNINEITLKYKILNDFMDSNLNYISFFMIAFEGNLECSKAANNLLLKMAEIETILKSDKK